MTNEEKFKLCYEQAQKVTAFYRDQCPDGLDPKATWAAVAVGVVGAGATLYAANSASKTAEEQAASQLAGLNASNATNEAFLNEMLTPIDIAALQGQSVNSNLSNFPGISQIGRQFSGFNTQDTLRASRAAGIDIPAFVNVLAQSAMGDITGSYYNTPIGREQIQNILSSTAPSMSVAANSLYSQPYANGTGVGENRFIGNFLRDSEQRRQGGLQQMGGLLDFGNSFSARLNSQTAALMQSQFVTPDVAIAAESQRRSLGTQTGLAALQANAGALGGINAGLNNSRMATAQAYGQAGQQLGNAAMYYGANRNNNSGSSSNLS
jgi:hypothetical protein